MAEALDQTAIDALLAAVDAGEIKEDGTSGQLFSLHRRNLQDVEIRGYDFKRPERVSKEQMRALETLHEAFARVFGAAISGFIRTIIEVKVAATEQMTYGEFIASLPNPTAFNLIETEQLDGYICLEVSPLIIYPMFDRMLGGTSTELFIPQRALTAIEIRLLRVLLDRALKAMTEAWSNIRELTFDLVETESNPHLVQIVPPNEVVVVVGFEIRMGSRAGTMNLCIPFNVIEPLMADLSAQSWFNVPRDKASDYSQRLSDSLSEASVAISATLAETSLTLDDLVHLSIGDLIVTEKEAAKPVVLTVEGERKFIGRIGQYNGSRAVRIDRPIRYDDRV